MVASNKYFSYLEFNLITGRQHQIRKHTALHNHPLLGDPRYNDPKYNQKMASIYKTDRLFLHCQELEIKEHRILSPIPEVFHQIVK
jgi:23S rRNA-/tRNA-specific pseudouridylate synthase